MVFGQMIAVETQTIVELNEIEALLVEIGEWQIIAVEMIENAELHGSPSGAERLDGRMKNDRVLSRIGSGIVKVNALGSGGNDRRRGGFGRR